MHQDAMSKLNQTFGDLDEKSDDDDANGGVLAKK
jgi:hypothetical protein